MLQFSGKFKSESFLIMSDACKKEIGSDYFVTCPYNPAHVYLKSREPAHVFKCAETAKIKGKMKRCRFNSAHVVGELEFKCHEDECVNRASYERYKYTPVANGESLSERAETHPPETFEPVESSDNWDHCDAPSYDPEKYATENAVIRLLPGRPPSERKEFRRAERARLQEFNN